MMIFEKKSYEIDVNKTSLPKECVICHYWYFLDKGFKFQPDVCNGWHDLVMMAINLNDIAILNKWYRLLL